MSAVEVVGVACHAGIAVGGTWSCCCCCAEVVVVVVVVIVTNVGCLRHHAKVVLSKFVDDPSRLPHHRHQAAGRPGFVDDACG